MTRSTQVGTSSLPERFRWDAYAEMKASALFKTVVSQHNVRSVSITFHDNSKHGAHLMSRTPGILSGVNKRRDYLEDRAENGGRVVGGGVWIVASGKIKFEASSLFCAVLRLVITPFSGQRLSADLVLSCRVIRVLLTVYLGYARKYAK